MVVKSTVARKDTRKDTRKHHHQLISAHPPSCDQSDLAVHSDRPFGSQSVAKVMILMDKVKLKAVAAVALTTKGPQQQTT